MEKNTIWYGLKPMAAVHKMNEGDLLFSGNKAFRKEKGNLEEIKKAQFKSKAELLQVQKC